MIAREKANKITATLKLVVTEEFYDDEASEETLRAYVEQCLEESGFSVEVELFKVQEPRVLTLKEVKGLQSLRDGAVWLETWSGAVFPILPEMSLSDVTYFVAIPFNTYRSWVENEYYGKTWRCWSAKPTKEQMEAVPWQD